MELQPGAYFKVGQEGFEYVGINRSPDDPTSAKVVARINPDEPSSQGALHRIFEPATLERDGVKIGPFNETLPYSAFVAEKAAWQTRFSHDIDIPHPPLLLVDTLRRAKEEGITSLEYHFLPGGTMERDGITIEGHKYLFSDLPDWKAPREMFFKSTELTKPTRPGKNELPSKISPEALSFPSCHILIDNTKKPDYQSGNQIYESDPFKKLIVDLADKLSPTIEGSRFHISYDARAEYFDPALANTLSLSSAAEQGKAKVTVPTEAIFNVVGNIFHPEWGDTSTYEWLENSFEDGRRLVGGDSDNGGLADVNDNWSDNRSGYIGFRPLVMFFS